MSEKQTLDTKIMVSYHRELLKTGGTKGGFDCTEVYQCTCTAILMITVLPYQPSLKQEQNRRDEQFRY